MEDILYCNNESIVPIAGFYSRTDIHDIIRSWKPFPRTGAVTYYDLLRTLHAV